MSGHYKKPSWYHEIDPVFNKVIKVYMENLSLMDIPSREGHLVLNLGENHLKRIEREGYPKLAKLYEKENIRDVFDDAKLVFLDEFGVFALNTLKKEAKKRGIFLEKLLQISSFVKEKDSKDYYEKSFEPLKSGNTFRNYTSGMTKEELKKYGRKIHSDILSMLCHIFLLNNESLKKDAKYIEMVSRNFLSYSKLLRRFVFFTWDVISLMNHKKSLRQLYNEAQKDDESLLNLLRLDKTLFDHEWVRVRMRKAMYSGDLDFIDSVADALKKGQFDTRKENLDITIALINFWKTGIYRLTIPQRMELLKDSGIEFVQNETAFSKIIERIRPFVDW